MSEKNPKAKWDRTSDVIQVIKDAQNPVGCIECHDPHSARHRIIIDALIEAVKKNGNRPYSKNNDKDIIDVREFRGYRKMGLLNKKDSVLQCAPAIQFLKKTISIKRLALMTQEQIYSLGKMFLMF